ncbi:MAG: TRAP transporter small permease [Verrucomicrobiae bacterium]|nr:TRAP transporter small permease [Verrucomicrobiae bacterium]NNJ86921.1 TRAP transporter small permease [Akkermansiaceae bacterium]
MKTFKSMVSKALNALCATILVALVVIVLLGILSKKLNLGLSWTDESSEFLLSWVVMIGAALAYLHNSHLGVDILTNAFTPVAKRLAAGFTAAVVFLFASVVMTYGGWNLFLDRYDSGQLLSSIAMKRAWFYFSIPISGLLISLFALDNIRQAITGKTDTNGEETVSS